MTLSFVTSLAATAAMSLVLVGFSRVWDDTHNHMMRNIRYGILTIIAVLILRSGYWDMLQTLLPRENWLAVRDALGGQDFSSVFNLGFLVACYFWLRAKWWLIPEDERDEWSWWNAWRYPPRLSLHVKVEK